MLLGINFRFVCLVSVRYFFFSRIERANSVVSFLAMFGITLGVFALIIVMSVMNGFRAELISNMISHSGEMTIVCNDPIIKYGQFLEKIQALEFVKKVRPVSLCYGLAEFGSHRNYVTIRGVDSAKIQLVAGTSEFLEHAKGIAISSSLARLFQCKVGDRLHLLDLTSMMQGECFDPREFIVKAIFIDSFEESNLILTSISSVSALCGSQVGVSTFAIDTINPELVEQFAQRCESFSFLRGCKIFTWKQLNPELLKALDIEHVSMFIILSLIILVAVSNALSSLIMTVKEKTREIAILRTMGTLSSEILLIFLLNGLAIGAIGILIGTSFAYLVILGMPFIKLLLHSGHNIKFFDGLCYFLDRIPLKILLTDVLEVTIFSIILSLCATLYPAYKASKIDPASVLK